MEDLKVSHCQESVVETLISQMEGEYGQETPVTVLQGIVHNYLGTTTWA